MSRLRNSTRVAAAAFMALGLSGVAARAAEITWWASEPLKDRAETLRQTFEKANPDIKIRIQYNPYAGLEDKILVALRSGNAPDIMEMQTSWIPSYAATGKLSDVSAVLAANKLTPADFVPAAIGTATIDGKVYGLPYQAEALAMLYNKGAFREAGLDPEKPPQTWPELVDAAKKLTKRAPDGSMKYGYGIAGGGPGGQSNVIYAALPYVWMNGGDVVSADLKSSPLASPASVEAVTFYADMLTKLKVAPPSTLENDRLALRRLFISGSVAMFQGTPTDYEGTKSAKGLEVGVGIIPHPEGKQTTALMGGWSFVMPVDGKNKEATAKFLQFLETPENTGLYTGTFPALTAGMNLPRFADPNLKAFKDMLANARAQPTVQAWVRITDVFFQAMQEVLLGSTDAKSAMTKAAAQVTPLLK